MDEPKNTYKSILRAYLSRYFSWIDPWMLGFGLVLIWMFQAVYFARNPDYLSVIGQRTGAILSVLLALISFVVTSYYEFA